MATLMRGEPVMPLDPKAAGAVLVLALDAFVRTLVREELAAAEGDLRKKYRSIGGPLPHDATRRTFIETSRKLHGLGIAGFEKVGRGYVVDVAAWHAARRVKRPSPPTLHIVPSPLSDEARAREMLGQAGYREVGSK
jgi:hypothetical protein